MRICYWNAVLFLPLNLMFNLVALYPLSKAEPAHTKLRLNELRHKTV